MDNTFFKKRILILLGLCVVFFFLGNGLISLTHPELFYSLVTKEMSEKASLMTPYAFGQPNFERPILTFWFLRLADWVGGINSASLRFFPSLFAMMGVVGVYCLGLIGFKNERKAFWSAIVLCSCVLYIVLAKMVLTDMIFAVLVLYSILFFYIAYSNPAKKTIAIIWFYIFAALATLCSGPLGIIIPELIVILFLLYRRQISFLTDRIFLGGFLVFMAIASPWYVAMIIKYGQPFIHEFFGQYAKNDTWYFYPITIVAGLFPWTLFLSAAFVGLFNKLKWGTETFDYFLLSWMMACVVVFQLAHFNNILVIFPALALLTGGYIGEALNTRKTDVINVFCYILAGAVVICGILVMWLYPHYKHYMPSMLPVYWLSGSLIVLGGIMLTYLLKENVEHALTALCATVFIFLCAGYAGKAEIEPYVSTFEIAQYLPQVNAKKSTILTLKPYAAGVKFYTGQNVAVRDIIDDNELKTFSYAVVKKQSKPSVIVVK
jgi:4-amino-4-deoxy-L-arabinose transferase-like glycosyltransferase